MLEKIKQKIYNFLRWTQRWTKTDMIYVAKGGFWLTLEKIILNLLGVISTLTFANYFSPEKYGTFQYILSIIPLLAIANLGGMDSAVTRSVAQGYDGSYMAGVKEKIKFGLIGSLASIGLACYYLIAGNNFLAIAFFLASIFIPLSESLFLYNAFLIGKKQFRQFSENNVLDVAFNLVVTLSALILTNNVLVVLAAYFFSTIAMRIYFTFKYLKKYKPNNNVDPKLLSFGKHLSLMGIIGTISTQIDKILVFHYLGAAQVAVYTFSLMPAAKLQDPILGTIDNLSMPKMSAISMEELSKKIPEKNLRLLFIIVPAVIGYIVLAPFAFHLFLPHYTGAIIYSQVYILSLLFIPKTLYAHALIAHAKTKELYIANTILPIIRIVAFLTLIPFFGIWGLIITQVANEALGFIIYFWLFTNTKKKKEQLAATNQKTASNE